MKCEQCGKERPVMFTLESASGDWSLCVGCYLQGFPVREMPAEDVATLDLLATEMKLNHPKNESIGVNANDKSDKPRGVSRANSERGARR